MQRLGLAAAAATFLMAPAAAQTPVPVPGFDSLELRGGGQVTVRHGASQQVRLVRGDPETTRFSVGDDGTLRIDACVRTCRGYRLEVEIVTPELGGVSVTGGGSVRADGRFPALGMLALAVAGGGAIDLAAVEAAGVAASVRGGGTIRTHARNSLIASINGTGTVRYLGDPSVTSAIKGGGSISPAG